jgi:hypothetical protein
MCVLSEIIRFTREVGTEGNWRKVKLRRVDACVLAGQRLHENDGMVEERYDAINTESVLLAVNDEKTDAKWRRRTGA